MTTYTWQCEVERPGHGEKPSTMIWVATMPPHTVDPERPVLAVSWALGQLPSIFGDGLRVTVKRVVVP